MAGTSSSNRNFRSCLRSQRLSVPSCAVCRRLTVASPSGLYRTSTLANVGSNSSMCAPKSAPYSNPNSSWPDFSTGIASGTPSFFARRATPAPNSSSTSTPHAVAGAPAASACTCASKISSLAAVIWSWTCADTGGVAPNRPCSNDPR